MTIPPASLTEIGAIRAAVATIPAKAKPANKRATSRRGRAPSAADFLNIPPASAGVYDLNDIETKKARSRLYGLNKENAAGWKWRTLREGTLLIVVRMH